MTYLGLRGLRVAAAQHGVDRAVRERRAGAQRHACRQTPCVSSGFQLAKRPQRLALDIKRARHIHALHNRCIP